MIQPDLRNLLIMLSHSATDAKNPLEYEAKHGTPPKSRYPTCRPSGGAPARVRCLTRSSAI